MSMTLLLSSARRMLPTETLKHVAADASFTVGKNLVRGDSSGVKLVGLKFRFK